MTKATQPARFLLSPSLFLSTSRLALHGQALAHLWFLRSLPSIEIGPSCLGPSAAVSYRDMDP